MAFDTYVELTGIEGEATAKSFEKKIEIFSFSWGASSPVTIGPGSAGISASRVSISSFNVMKKTDVASPKLFKACCLGEHLAKMIVSMRKQTGVGGQDVFLTYTFEQVMVESVQWSGSSGGDDTPTESVSFAFAKVTVHYKAQGPDGKLTAGTPVMWDVTKVSAGNA
jgi:type VI secretion system secreted protein Hcp